MRAYVEVDLGAIAHNIAKVKSQTQAEILAVVKADAYGHGLVPVAQCALESGATYLGVALLEEALALRAAGIDAPTIAWLTPLGEDFERAISQNIDLSVSSIALFEAILNAGARVGIKPRIHFEIDTGMHRGGVLGEWKEFLNFALAHQNEYELIGFWSHFARADEPIESYNQLQLDEFDRALAELKSSGLHPVIVHFANSAAALSLPTAHRQMVRLGIAMYGLSPDVTTMGSSQDLGLRPAMSVFAKLHLVKEIKAGDAVGYGGVGVAGTDTTIGIVVMGYADGLPRIAAATTGVVHGQSRAPLIGRVSMDQCVVDLGPESSAKAGDYVAVISAQGFSADDWASAAGTINYEIVTRIATRVARIYR